MAEPPADDFSSADDFKAPPSPPPRAKRKPPPLTEAQKFEAELDSDDSAPPPPPRRPKHPAASPVEDMVDTAKGNWPPEDAAPMDADPPPKRHKHARLSDDDAPSESFEDHTSHKSPVPAGFEGGWRSLMKNKPAKKKHKFQDQTNGIMDLVQTPTTYTAWHPDSTDTVLKKSAKAELSAAERAFDAPDGAESFLQLDLFTEDQAAAGDGSSAAVAQMLLEQYATTLNSAMLSQLARAELSVSSLKTLWKQIAAVNASTAHGEHEAQSIKWCQDFQRQTRESANKKRSVARQAMLELATTQTQSLVYGQEAKAQGRFLGAVKRDVQGLRELLGRVSHQCDSTGAVTQKLQKDILRTLNLADTSLQPKFSDLLMSLGKVEGLVSAGNAELVDMIKAAAARRDKSGTMWQDSLAQVQEEVGDVQKQQARLAEQKAEQAEESDQEDGLKDRYQQMCTWTLDDFQARQRQDQCEKTAVQAALIVLST